MFFACLKNKAAAECIEGEVPIQERIGLKPKADNRHEHKRAEYSSSSTAENGEDAEENEEAVHCSHHPQEMIHTSDN